jgi:hypothetical protein
MPPREKLVDWVSAHVWRFVAVLYPISAPGSARRTAVHLPAVS